MEMIEISGYVTEEKVEIAKRYLIPKQHEETGVKNGQINITDESLTYLIDKHCRESGVRNLQKKIQRIFRKAAVKVVKGESVEIDTPCLPDYVGRAIWNKVLGFLKQFWIFWKCLNFSEFFRIFWNYFKIKIFLN